jgi:adenylate kinase family enzyme
MKRVVILGRGGAGKSTLALQFGNLMGLPVTELDTLFWQPGLAATDAAQWAASQQELTRRDTWIIDGDLGPYEALYIRLRAAETIIILNLAFPWCAWRTLRRGGEQADYWRWVWSYRRRYLPGLRRVPGLSVMPDMRGG